MKFNQHVTIPGNILDLMAKRSEQLGRMVENLRNPILSWGTVRQIEKAMANSFINDVTGLRGDEVPKLAAVAAFGTEYGKEKNNENTL